MAAARMNERRPFPRLHIPDAEPVRLDETLAEPGLPRILCQRLLRLLAGLGDQDVGAVDDLVRLRLPTVARALFLVVAGHLAHCVEWAERHAEADMVPRRKVAGLAAGAEGIHRRQRLLQRLWPARVFAPASISAVCRLTAE